MVKAYLNGALTVQQLPVYHGSPNGPAPVTKRLLLPQGELAQFWDSDLGLHYLAAIEIAPGQVRGSHYHRKKEEFLYILSGRVLLYAEIPGQAERVNLELQPGDFVNIKPGTAHALRGVERGLALEGSPTRFDASDAQRHTFFS